MRLASEPDSPSTSSSYFELKRNIASVKKSPRLSSRIAELRQELSSTTMRRTNSANKPRVHSNHPIGLMREVSRSLPDCSLLDKTNFEGSTARASIPQLQRVRSFRKTSKGLVNRGDTFCKTRSCVLSVKKSRGVTVPSTTTQNGITKTRRSSTPPYQASSNEAKTRERHTMIIESQVENRSSTPTYDASAHDATTNECHTVTTGTESQVENRIFDMKKFESKRRAHASAGQQNGNVLSTHLHIPSTGFPRHNSFRVAMLGASAVGKSSLTQQFMTSEYLGGFDSPTGDLETSEASVCVRLDEEHSTIRFTEQLRITEDIVFFDGYIVVFDVTDRDSYNYGVDLITRLRREHGGTGKAVILVANKTDLVRKRQVSAKEAKSVSRLNKCKYIETSAAINHHVDELLAGIASELHKQGSSTPGNERDQKFNWNECIDKVFKNFVNMIWRKPNSCKTRHDWL